MYNDNITLNVNITRFNIKQIEFDSSHVANTPMNVSQSAKRSNTRAHPCSLSFYLPLSLSLNDQDFRFAACLLVHVEKVLVNTLEIELKPAGEKSAPRCERCSVIENKTIMECRTITQLISLDLGCLIGASRVCKPCEPRFFFQILRFTRKKEEQSVVYRDNWKPKRGRGTYHTILLISQIKWNIRS